MGTVLFTFALSLNSRYAPDKREIDFVISGGMVRFKGRNITFSSIS